MNGSNLGPVKLGTVLPTARHRYDISLKGAVLPGRKLFLWVPPTHNKLRRSPQRSKILRFFAKTTKF